jgi:hypothetical protein
MCDGAVHNLLILAEKELYMLWEQLDNGKENKSDWDQRWKRGTRTASEHWQPRDRRLHPDIFRGGRSRWPRRHYWRLGLCDCLVVAIDWSWSERRGRAAQGW